MASSATIPGLPSTFVGAATEDVTINRFDPAVDLKELDRGEDFAKYLVVEGVDPAYPVTVTVAITKRKLPNGTEGQGVMVTLDAWLYSVINDVAVDPQPVQFKNGWNLPKKNVPFRVDVIAAVSALYGLLFAISASPGAPDTSVVDEAAYGVSALFSA